MVSGSLAYIVSAWAAQNRLPLGQVKVDDKSSEITAIPELLRVLDMTGCIVTIDAMGCQKKIAHEIVARGADCLFSLKNNQGNMLTEVAELFAAMPLEKIAAGQAPPDLTCAFHQTVDADHGRVETRRCWCTSDIVCFADRRRWKGLASFGMVETQRDTKGKISTQRRCLISKRLMAGWERAWSSPSGEEVAIVTT